MQFDGINLDKDLKTGTAFCDRRTMNEQLDSTRTVLVLVAGPAIRLRYRQYSDISY